MRRHRPPRYQLLQTVYSLVDVPSDGCDEPVHRGQSGTIVHVFENSKLGTDAYLVEFINDDGETLAEPELTGDQLSVVPPPP